MSEQRFTFGAVSPNVSMIKLDGKPLNVEDVIVCLNKLCDEIKKQQTTITSLKEENEELKHWKKRMIDYLSDWFKKTEYLSVLNKITEINNEIGFDIDE